MQLINQCNYNIALQAGSHFNKTCIYYTLSVDPSRMRMITCGEKNMISNLVWKKLNEEKKEKEKDWSVNNPDPLEKTRMLQKSLKNTKLAFSCPPSIHQLFKQKFL
jgi:hypothetical protein